MQEDKLLRAPVYVLRFLCKAFTCNLLTTQHEFSQHYSRSNKLRGASHDLPTEHGFLPWSAARTWRRFFFGASATNSSCEATCTAVMEPQMHVLVIQLNCETYRSITTSWYSNAFLLKTNIQFLAGEKFEQLRTGFFDNLRRFLHPATEIILAVFREVVMHKGGLFE